MQVKNALDKLPPQQKKIILLNMEGLNNNKIGDELKISINTVKLQKKVAYEKLRNELSAKLYYFIII